MKALLDALQNLMNGPVRLMVERRVTEFEQLDKKERFSELCFCLLTANYTAEGGLRIQKALGKKFLTLPEKELALKLKELGHRFPNARAKYIVEARRVSGELNDLPADGKRAREWLLRIKGLGMKEASHFLRNVGYKDVAIIDRHILHILFEHGLIEAPKVNAKSYCGIENTLERLGREAGLDLSRLDLYLWYMKTGKILK